MTITVFMKDGTVHTFDCPVEWGLDFIDMVRELPMVERLEYFVKAVHGAAKRV